MKGRPAVALLLVIGLISCQSAERPSAETIRAPNVTQVEDSPEDDPSDWIEEIVYGGPQETSADLPIPESPSLPTTTANLESPAWASNSHVPTKTFGPTAYDSADARLNGPLFDRDGGISLQPVYYGEVFTNTRGGISTGRATRYEALLDFPLTLNFEKMDLPLPGRFFLLAQTTHGQGLTEDFIGDIQVVSNIDSFDNILQVSEYWWEFGLFDDKVTVRLGKQDLNTEFLVMDLAGDFIQSSFGLSPSGGFPSYPDPSMATVVLAQITPSVRLKVGIWDALASGGGWGFSGNDVTLAIGELEYKYALSDARLPGAVELGVAYSSGGDVSGLDFPSAHGYYVQLEQLIFREKTCDVGDTQGLGLFISYFPRFPNGEVPIPTIPEDVVGGIVYTGLLPTRDEDVVGAGVAWARLNQGGTNQETAVELFYKVQITPSMILQPDLQYIATPSGIYRDALVVGTRFQVIY